MTRRHSYKVDLILQWVGFIQLYYYSYIAELVLGSSLVIEGNAKLVIVNSTISLDMFGGGNSLLFEVINAGR